MNKTRLEERALLFTLCFFFVYITVAALGFPGEAKIFPLAIGGPGLLLCLILIVQIMLRTTPDDRAESDHGGSSKQDGMRSWIAYGLGLFYFAVVWVFGYLIGTAIIALLVPPLLGEQRKKLLFGFSIGLVLFVGLAFQLLLKVPLPKGMLF